MKFIAHVANAGATGARVVVDAGVLDVILNLYIDAFIPQVPAYKSSSLFLTCTKVLSQLVTHPEGMESVCAHHVRFLWPRRALMPLSHAVYHQIYDRRRAWRSLHLESTSVSVRRITGINHILNLSNFPANFPWNRRDFPSNELANMTTDLFDDFVDLIEFLR